MEGTLRCVSHNQTAILLLLHALYDLFTSTNSKPGWLAALRLYRLSLHYKIVISLRCPGDLLRTHMSGSLFSENSFSHLDSASLHPDSILCWQYTRLWLLYVCCCKNAKKDTRKRMAGEGRDRNLNTAGVSNCCNHCRDVPDFTHLHTYGLQNAR